MAYVSECVTVGTEFPDETKGETAEAIQKVLDVGVKKGWKLHSCQPTSGYVGVELFNPNRTANSSYLLIWEIDARIP